jgi:protein TonB
LIFPQLFALGILLSVARPPAELFGPDLKAQKKEKRIEVELSQKPEELAPPPPMLEMSASLAPDMSSSGEGLASLTAGVVSSGKGGGVSGVAQGQVDTASVVSQGQVEARPPQIAQQTAPQYPSTAQSQGIEGHVLLQIQVLADCRVGEVKVLEAKPVGVFEASALKAVRGWRYKPGIQNGTPQIMWVKHRMNFALD